MRPINLPLSRKAHRFFFASASPLRYRGAKKCHFPRLTTLPPIFCPFFVQFSLASCGHMWWGDRPSWTPSHLSYGGPTPTRVMKTLLCVRIDGREGRGRDCILRLRLFRDGRWVNIGRRVVNNVFFHLGFSGKYFFGMVFFSFHEFLVQNRFWRRPSLFSSTLLHLKIE